MRDWPRLQSYSFADKGQSAFLESAYTENKSTWCDERAIIMNNLKKPAFSAVLFLLLAGAHGAAMAGGLVPTDEQAFDAGGDTGPLLAESIFTGKEGVTRRRTDRRHRVSVGETNAGCGNAM